MHFLSTFKNSVNLLNIKRLLLNGFIGLMLAYYLFKVFKKPIKTFLPILLAPNMSYRNMFHFCWLWNRELSIILCCLENIMWSISFLIRPCWVGQLWPKRAVCRLFLAFLLILFGAWKSLPGVSVIRYVREFTILLGLFFAAPICMLHNLKLSKTCK